MVLFGPATKYTPVTTVGKPSPLPASVISKRITGTLSVAIDDMVPADNCVAGAATVEVWSLPAGQLSKSPLLTGKEVPVGDSKVTSSIYCVSGAENPD